MSEIVIEHVLPPSDHKRLEKLLKELDEIIIPKLSDRVKISAYAKKLSAYAELFYVCEEGIDIGNCAVYLNDSKDGYISSIAIKKEWQNQGIGKLLWKSVLECAVSKQIKKIELMVSKDNKSAIAFYKSLNFEEAEENKQWIKMRYKVKKREY